MDTVRRWRGRFAQAGLPGRKDRRRCGRPASGTPLHAAEAKALTCRLPAETRVPLSHLSCPEVAREAAPAGHPYAAQPRLHAAPRHQGTAPPHTHRPAPEKAAFNVTRLAPHGLDAEIQGPHISRT
ncbi:hypothetical protein [Streptomyces sp. NPDC042319]|uniref:hypothetical protein n=1 Tax=Streptomyces sp. NPDC042319 TaxID=3154332 RepID=UPI003401060D